MDYKDLYDDELDAIRDAVKHLGGPKVVGSMFWPEKTPDGAGRYMHDCLNGNRAERLSPGQLLVLMRKARNVGFHGLATFYMREAGYMAPVPNNPSVEAAQITLDINAAVKQLTNLVERAERIKAAAQPAQAVQGD